MRGKVTAGSPLVNDVGITPAYAGKSHHFCGLICGQGDHPRLCGEKAFPVDVQLSRTGSPPPMRGKGNTGREKYQCIGITPAYAGKSLTNVPIRYILKDHPRLCGEKSPRSAGRTSQAGSPPPMRGKDGFRVPAADRSRITPAYAGKSPLQKPHCCWYRDHPRLCGEKLSHRTDC